MIIQPRYHGRQPYVDIEKNNRIIRWLVDRPRFLEEANSPYMPREYRCTLYDLYFPASARLTTHISEHLQDIGLGQDEAELLMRRIF